MINNQDEQNDMFDLSPLFEISRNEEVSLIKPVAINSLVNIISILKVMQDHFGNKFAHLEQSHAIIDIASNIIVRADRILNALIKTDNSVATFNELNLKYQILRLIENIQHDFIQAFHDLDLVINDIKVNPVYKRGGCA